MSLRNGRRLEARKEIIRTSPNSISGRSSIRLPLLHSLHQSSSDLELHCLLAIKAAKLRAPHSMKVINYEINRSVGRIRPVVDPRRRFGSPRELKNERVAHHATLASVHEWYHSAQSFRSALPQQRADTLGQSAVVSRDVPPTNVLPTNGARSGGCLASLLGSLSGGETTSGAEPRPKHLEGLKCALPPRRVTFWASRRDACPTHPVHEIGEGICTHARSPKLKFDNSLKTAELSEL